MKMAQLRLVEVHQILHADISEMYSAYPGSHFIRMVWGNFDAGLRNIDCFASAN